MQRRAFTLAGLFSAIGAAIGQALGRDSTPQPNTLSRLPPPEPAPRSDPWTPLSEHTIKVGRKIMRVSPDGGGWEVYADTAEPENLKRWDAAPAAQTPTWGAPVYATLADPQVMLAVLEQVHRDMSPPTTSKEEMRGAIYDLIRRLHEEIGRRATMCDGHHGPSPLSEMTEMPDGRRLCGYCHKQEIDHAVQLAGSARGQAPAG